MTPAYLKNCRAALGLSQVQAARIFGCSLRSIQRQENGQSPVQQSFWLTYNAMLSDKVFRKSIHREFGVKAIEPPYKGIKLWSTQ